MSADFKDPNEFDNYVWEKGKWAYDNGWRYKGEPFGSAYIREEFDSSEAGSPNYLLMLRDGPIPHRALILHVIGPQLIELWSGQVESKADFDKMMIFVNSYIQEYKAKN